VEQLRGRPSISRDIEHTDDIAVDLDPAVREDLTDDRGFHEVQVRD